MRLTANLLILVLAILNTSHEDGGLVGEDETLAILAQVLVASPQDGVQHALVQQEVAHPLGDDDVDLGEGQLHLLHLALQQRDLVAHPVGLDDLARLDDDGRHVDADDVLRAGLHREPAIIASVSMCLFTLAMAVCCAGHQGRGIVPYMLRMDVPHPTSRTTLSLKMCRLL
jgi:hypothetical protein